MQLAMLVTMSFFNDISYGISYAIEYEVGYGIWFDSVYASGYAIESGMSNGIHVSLITMCAKASPQALHMTMT